MRSAIATAMVAATLFVTGCGSSTDVAGSASEPTDPATSAPSETTAPTEAASTATPSTTATPTPEPESTAVPATGATITTADFQYTVPDGWRDAPELRGAAVTLAIDANDQDGFADNVNVVTDPMLVGLDTDEISDGLLASLESAGATEVEVRGTTAVAGTPAVHSTAVFNFNDTDYRTEQYAMYHDGAGYVITFSHSMDVPESERDAVDGSILATWVWL